MIKTIRVTIGVFFFIIIFILTKNPSNWVLGALFLNFAFILFDYIFPILRIEKKDKFMNKTDVVTIIILVLIYLFTVS